MKFEKTLNMEFEKKEHLAKIASPNRKMLV
jgi:hypothetical protein